MNKFIRHFFISSLVSQTERALKKEIPNHQYGKLISLSFMIGKDEKVIQRLKFENFAGDKTLSEDEKQKLLKLISIDVSKEMKGENESKKPCKSIFATINVEQKTIIIQWNYIDGTNKNLNL